MNLLKRKKTLNNPSFSHRTKILVGVVFGLMYFLTYTFALFFVKNPYEDVDCRFGKNNQYVATIMRKDCKTKIVEINP